MNRRQKEALGWEIWVLGHSCLNRGSGRWSPEVLREDGHAKHAAFLGSGLCKTPLFERYDRKMVLWTAALCACSDVKVKSGPCGNHCE